MDLKKLRYELRRIRKQIRVGDESELWVWVLPDLLACAQRPLRDHNKYFGRSPLPIDARPLVESWVDRIVGAKFQSIISLLEVAQLDRYYVRGGIELHPKGLLCYYESRGLKTESIPCTDYQPPTNAQMGEALEAFRRLPKPVLLHCSASIDRTAPVATFICENRE